VTDPISHNVIDQMACYNVHHLEKKVNGGFYQVDNQHKYWNYSAVIYHYKE
jgi:hypothetical protein